MTLIDILKLLGEVGTPLVCAGVLILQYISNNKFNQKNYSQLLQVAINNNSKPHVLSSDENKKYTEVEAIIKDNIKVLLNNTKASRVCVVRYHNGGVDMAGNSFLKMSMTNEVVNTSIKPLITDFQNQFRSLMSYWCQTLEETGYCFIPRIGIIKNKDIAMYEFLASRNVKSNYGVALKSKNDTVIGFVCVEYLYTPKEMDDTIKSEIYEKAAIISNLLNLEN